jgi:hypothetical protein
MQVATCYGKSKKPPSNVIHKFQKVWIVKMPWAKAIFNYQNIVSIVRCIVCSKIDCKEKLLVLKWVFLRKHVGKRKNDLGEKVMD